MCILRGFAQVQYKRKNGYGLGRVNPVGSMGLHSLTRATRHTLVKYLMVDIDIENAHIILLLQMLIYNKVTTVCWKIMSKTEVNGSKKLLMLLNYWNGKM